MEQDQADRSLVARVRRQTERRALQQARRIPWKTVTATAEEYTEWEVFTLWLRAVVAAAEHLPEIAARELESRAPLLLESIRTQADTLAKCKGSLAAKIWKVSHDWIETAMFCRPRRDGWLDAVRYFSSVSLNSMKAWSYWESIQSRRLTLAPHLLGDYARWKCEVAAVSRLSPGNDLAQHALEMVRSIPEPEWSGYLVSFFDLIAFSLWMELVLDIEGPTSALVAAELAKRYGGFRLGSLGSKDAVRALHDWMIDSNLVGLNRRQLLAALSFHVTNHPSYHALRSYALICHNVWPGSDVSQLPAFEEWRRAADEYVEK